MSWYSQPPLNSSNDSLITAFANLLKKLGDHNDPVSLSELLADVELNWDAITEYDDGVYPSKIGDYGTWPETNNAIVKFRCISARTGLAVDHFCLVASAEDRTIVDSLDGEVKSPGVYGQPSGWASYVIEDEQGAVEETALDEPIIDNHTYVVNGAGESCWDVSRRLKLDNLSGRDIADHNDVEDAQAKLAPGTRLRIPYEIPSDGKKPGIRFELLPEKMPMHVTKDGGTRQLTFGLHDKWEHIKPTGSMHQEGANVDIVAIAHVPILDEDKEAMFYMDSHAVGSYEATGKVAWTIGFSHAHLDEGHVEAAPAVELKPEVQERLEEAKAVIESFKPPVPVMDIVIKPPTVATPPTEVVVPDDDSDIEELRQELHRTMDFPTRVAIHGRLSPVERYFTVPFAKMMAQKVRIKALFKNK